MGENSVIAHEEGSPRGAFDINFIDIQKVLPSLCINPATLTAHVSRDSTIDSQPLDSNLDIQEPLFVSEHASWSFAIESDSTKYLSIPINCLFHRG